MNKSIIKTGYLSALLCAISLVIWIISFTGIALTSPLFYWTNLQDYLEYVNNNNQFFHYLAKVFMIVFAVSFFIMLVSLHEQIHEERKFYLRLGLFFGFGFTLLSNIHYFTQISTVRFAINNGDTEGICHFLQANPLSFSSSLNMLGWTLFLGLSSVFMFMATRKNNVKSIIPVTFLINGISCLLAGFGFLVQIDIITFICINLGTGGALLILSFSLAKHFKKMPHYKKS